MPGPPSHLYIAPNPKNGTLTLVTCPPLVSYELSVLPFFDARSDGLKRVAVGPEHFHTDESGVDDSQAETQYYVRTPNGEGVGVIHSDGCGEVWTYDWAKTRSLEKTGKWMPAETGRVDKFVVIDAGQCLCELHAKSIAHSFQNLGRYFATYSSETGLLTLHTSPPASLSVPKLSLLFVLSAPHSVPVRTLIGVTTSRTVLLISATLSGPSHSLMLMSEHALPLSASPKMILPVDPMAWVGQLTSKSDATGDHDVLLSVSEDGELAFWIPENVLSKPTGNGDARATNGVVRAETVWKCTGQVKTGRKGITMASCSSAKKSSLGD